MELAFAGLHQLCVPLMNLVDGLPEPQRDALNVAFGRGVGPTPDRFLVGLAVLSLLAAASEGQPLLCVVDDAQWLDEVSVQVLGFVARRLMAESVAVIAAVRDAPAKTSQRDFGSYMSRAWSPTWSWLSPGFTSCAFRS